jgi:hypothetical protein
MYNNGKPMDGLRGDSKFDEANITLEKGVDSKEGQKAERVRT